MTAYIIRRLIQALFVLVMVSLLVFFVLRLLPGDPIMVYLTEEEFAITSPERIEALRTEFGLDKSIIVQYFNWIGDIFHGDLGVSLMHKESVAQKIARALPITLYLGVISFIISSIVGVSLGVISALKRGKPIDTVVTLLSIIGITMPNFWLAILMVYLFALKLGWLPTTGFVSPFDDFWMSIKLLIMPVTCMFLMSLASKVRQTRSSMLEVIRQDYIRTAWSKGLKERTIIIKHALKNGLIPVVTLLGLHVGHIFGGSVIAETIFNIPGMGRLVVNAIWDHDYIIVQSCLLIITAVITLANLVVDISYGWLDPRIKLA